MTTTHPDTTEATTTTDRGRTFAYADPPYRGHAQREYGHLHPEASNFDHLATHIALVEELQHNHPHAWAYSCNSKDLATILPYCGPTHRVAAWTSDSRQPGNDRIIDSWEPVIYDTPRCRRTSGLMVRDTLHAGNGRNQYTTRFIGAKPPQFTRWLIALLGLEPDDHLLDMFPGSGRVSRAAAQGRLL